MLQKLTDGLRSSKLFAGAIILIIVVPFALWGIGSYVRGGGNTYAAVVNDVEISPNELERAYIDQRNRLQQMFGGRLPAQFADGQVLRQQALDSLINRELLFQEARSRGYSISDSTLAQTLLQIDAFKQDGKFDQERYEMQLRSQGLSPSEFERSTKSSLVIDQMRRALSSSDFVLAKETSRIQALRDQTRSLRYVSLPRNPLLEQQTVTDEEVQAYFDANTEQFSNPAKVKIEYVELDEAGLAAGIDVEESDIVSAYEARKAEFQSEEERDAAHILVTVPTDADEEQLAQKKEAIDEVARLLDEGADFAEMAKKYSEDPGSAGDGGNLGSVTRGVMVKEFEDVLFAMENAGDVSEPFRTDFGFHVIKLNSVTPSVQRTLDEVRSEIVNEMKRQRAENLFFDRAELLGNSSYENPGSLQPSAEATGLTLQTSEWIDRNSTAGIASYPELRAAALSDIAITERRNSDLIELGDNHVVVFRVADYQPSEPKPLAEVEEQIRSILRANKASDALRAQSEKAMSALQDGADPETVVTEYGGEWIDRGMVGRNEVGVARPLLDTLFALPAPTGKPSLGTGILDSGDMAVLVLDQVETPATEQTQADADVRQAIEQARGNRAFEAWLRNLRENADIQISSSIFQ